MESVESSYQLSSQNRVETYDKSRKDGRRYERQEGNKWMQDDEYAYKEGREGIKKYIITERMRRKAMVNKEYIPVQEGSPICAPIKPPRRGGSRQWKRGQ